MSHLLETIKAELEAQVASLGQPRHRRSFNVADVDVEVRVFGDQLAHALLPAFDGRPPSRPDTDPLVVTIWDHTATRTQPPAALRELAVPGQQPRYVDGTNHLTVGDGMYGLVTVGDAQASALVTVDDASTMPLFHRGAPAALQLAGLLGRRGRTVVHAACVGKQAAGGLLIVGKGGSGKSTTALRCLAAGWQYVGDDYVVLRPADATAHALYSTAKLAPTGFADASLSSLVPLGVQLIANPERDNGNVVGRPIGSVDKTVSQLWPACSAQMPASLPIRAVVAPKVGTGVRSSWRPAPAGHGLLALAPSTLLQLPTASSAQLAPLTRLVRSVPAIMMELGSDPAGVVAALAEVLNFVGGEP